MSQHYNYKRNLMRIINYAYGSADVSQFSPAYKLSLGPPPEQACSKVYSISNRINCLQFVFTLK